MTGAGWEIGDDEVRAAFALSPEDRYALLLQLTCDWEEAWGLRNPDGWVLARDPARGDAFPLWPHPEFARICARACAHGPWGDAVTEAIPLAELLGGLLPLLAEDGLRVAAFPVPSAPAGESRLVSPEALRRDLEAELALGE